MVELNWPFEITQKQIDQFETFRTLLVDWNQRMNLTSITERDEVYIKHFYDSVILLQIPEFASRIKSGMRVIDVGTGAGFPGIPLAIALPDVHFVLCDALQKRITFLETVVSNLGLQNVSCVHARSEDLGQNAKYRGQFDGVVSRAVARFNVLVELMCPFLKVNGVGFSYKGPNFEEELADGTRAAEKLNVNISNTHLYALPEDMGTRTVVCFEQQKPLAKRYPRKAGVPQRDPL